MMARVVRLDEQSVEFQVGLRDLRRRHAAPLWAAAVAIGDWDQMADAKALAGVLDAAGRIARRMAGRERGMCADGLLEPGHGLAA